MTRSSASHERQTADSGPAPKSPSWRDQVRAAIRRPEALLAALDLPGSLLVGARQAAREFELMVPQAFLARMRKGDPDDPLLRQVLPLAAECAPAPAGYVADPVGDLDAARQPGLLQKYAGRALLITAPTCAVACRYCFRRHFPYGENQAGKAEIPAMLEEIAASPDLEEIILSGGDPLMRSDAWLRELVAGLEAIPQLRRIRVHSRLPVVIPDRITEGLLQLLGDGRLAPSLVVHCNHPAELDAACGAALLRVVRRGIPVLNQAVLLAGVNDDADTQVALSQRLLDFRVLPYYLHQLDPVLGAAHFEVPVARGLEILAAMRRRLPGLGVPRYVREEAGATHKLPCRAETGGGTPATRP